MLRFLIVYAVFLALFAAPVWNGHLAGCLFRKCHRLIPKIVFGLVIAGGVVSFATFGDVDGMQRWALLGLLMVIFAIAAIHSSLGQYKFNWQSAATACVTLAVSDGFCMLALRAQTLTASCIAALLGLLTLCGSIAVILDCVKLNSRSWGTD